MARYCKDCPETDPEKFGEKTNRCHSCSATYNRSNTPGISKRDACGMLIGEPMQPTEFDAEIEANRIETLIR